jgi:uncharacterized protein
MDIIYSHGSCPDGFVAALIATRRYPEAEVIFLDHGADHTENLKKAEGKDVLMLDFSLRTREQNDALAASARSFRVLDHHRTAEVVLNGAQYAVFDMTRSGAGLAWDYLFGNDSNYWLELESDAKQVNPRPWYVDYVEDRDLWNWKLPNSREVCAYLGTLPFEFSEWDKLDHLDKSTVLRLGQGALAHINHYVREAVKQAQIGKLRIPWQEGGATLRQHKVAVLNVPYLNCSEVGNELAKTADFSLTWFERGDGITQFSLRSIGDFDVSEIAKKYGGGGHKNAAGFQMEYSKARLLIDVILGRSSYAIEPGTCVR